MPVRVLTPCASSSLISLSTVKLYLKITSTDTDTLLSSLISAASSSMISYLSVHPGRQQYEETARGEGQYRLYLSQLPVEPGTLSVLISDTDSPSSEWSLEDPATGLLYREGLWTHATLGELNLKFTYYAGFLLPDQITDWTAATAFAAGAWVRPSTPSLYRYECTTAGTSGATIPTFPTTVGSTVTDGACVWTARQAQELPLFVSQWCFAEVLRLDMGRTRAPGLASYSVEGVSESYFATHTEGELAPNVLSGLRRWRTELGVVGIA